MGSNVALSLTITPDAVRTRQRWLSLSAEIERTERRLHMLKAERQTIKPVIMGAMGKWGMSDELITGELRRGI